MVAKSGHALSTLPESDPVALAPVPQPSGPGGPAALLEAPHAVRALADIAPRDPQVAAYIAHMSIEMAAMARAAGFDLLAYFLDMARIEANIQSGKDG